MDEIQQRILQKLDEIEQQEQVTILHCVESGSRAWGFASPDSDYDVRFVYLRRTEDYLRLQDTRDVIDWQLDDVYDINGWDIRKYLQLLHKSNPTTFEWDASPIVYRTHPAWASVREVLPECFGVKTSAFHYLSIAKRNEQGYLRGETVKRKKYFYVLRPLLACRWVLERRTAPPMLFDELKEAFLPAQYRPAVEELLAAKKSQPEMGAAPRIEVLHQFIAEETEALRVAAEAEPPANGMGWKRLDQVFLELLHI